MNNIGFFTAVRYNSDAGRAERLLQTVDNYFYIGGKKLNVIYGKDGRRATVFADTNSSLLARVVKVATYFTIILPLILLTVKAVLRFSLRSTYNFKQIDPKKEIESGDWFATKDEKRVQANIQVITALLTEAININELKNLEGICQGKLNNVGNGLSYQLIKEGDYCQLFLRENKGSDNLLVDVKFSFYVGDDKTATMKKIDEQYLKMVKIKEQCLANDLDRIKVPKVKVYPLPLDNIPALIAEERLAFLVGESPSIQSQNYSEASGNNGDINAIIRQVTIIAARTGFAQSNDRNYPFGNFPLLEDRDVGAVNFGIETGPPVNNVRSTPSRLIRLATTPVQIEVMNRELANQGFSRFSKKEIAKRMTEVQEVTDWNEYYRRLTIRHLSDSPNEASSSKPNWPIIIEDPQFLGLNLDESDIITIDNNPIEITMKKSVMSIVCIINNCIQYSPFIESIKARRFIDLDLMSPSSFIIETLGKSNIALDQLIKYQKLGCISANEMPVKREKTWSGGVNFVVNDVAWNHLWMPRILQALKDNGHIFSFKVDKVNHHYYIQA